jgi:hypothetical protein
MMFLFQLVDLTDYAGIYVPLKRARLIIELNVKAMY